MDKKLLSIIIPVYNTEKYLERCLESVINQSYKHTEIIIINDGSTDNSHEIINQYCNNNNIIYIALEKNQGLGNARNIGLENAKGDYVTFIDSDDWIDSNFYSTLVNQMENYSLDVAIAGIINEFDDRKISTYRYKYPFDNQITGKFALSLLIKSNNQDIYITPIVNNKVYRRSFIENLGLRFINNNYNEDDVFSFLLFKESQKVGIVKETFYHYFQRDTSITGRYKQKHIDDLIFAYKYLIETRNLDKLDSDVIKYFDRNITFIFDLLFRTNLTVYEIKQNLVYIFKRVNEIYSLGEIIQYVDLKRIRQFLCV